jgi:hypothetical protein
MVKGKPHKPSTQGCVEVSHKAFKNALGKWLDKEKRENPEDPIAGQDYIVGASIVQCEINNAPIKVRNHTTPYMVYFGKMNKNNYSAVLGKAHNVAKSEYGLMLAKSVFEQKDTITPSEAHEKYLDIRGKNKSCRYKKDCSKSKSCKCRKYGKLCDKYCQNRQENLLCKLYVVRD